jgi:hypothetical protein
MAPALPVRLDGKRPDRLPTGLAVPPARMPLVHGGRPLKRWRYVAAFSERFMLCAAVVRIGPARQEFWAVWDRERGALRERTRLKRGFVSFGPGGAVVVSDGSVEVRAVVEPGAPVEVVSPHGDAWIWTRKQGGVRVRGTVAIDGEERVLDAFGCVDDSAGYHARHTAWRWSAGVGVAATGAAVAWNLVDGVHDAPVASERTVWFGGDPVEVLPVTFADDLGGVGFGEGGGLVFTAEATRARRERLVIAGSDYVAPFGTFAGRCRVGSSWRRGSG